MPLLNQIEACLRSEEFSLGVGELEIGACLGFVEGCFGPSHDIVGRDDVDQITYGYFFRDFCGVQDPTLKNKLDKALLSG